MKKSSKFLCFANPLVNMVFVLNYSSSKFLCFANSLVNYVLCFTFFLLQAMWIFFCFFELIQYLFLLFIKQQQLAQFFFALLSFDIINLLFSYFFLLFWAFLKQQLAPFFFQFHIINLLFFCVTIFFALWAICKLNVKKNMNWNVTLSKFF